MIFILCAVSYRANKNRWHNLKTRDKNDTAADYAIMIQGLPSDVTDADLVAYFEDPYFDDLVSNLGIYDGGVPVTKATIVEDTVVKDSEGSARSQKKAFVVRDVEVTPL